MYFLMHVNVPNCRINHCCAQGKTKKKVKEVCIVLATCHYSTHHVQYVHFYVKFVSMFVYQRNVYLKGYRKYHFYEKIQFVAGHTYKGKKCYDTIISQLTLISVNYYLQTYICILFSIQLLKLYITSIGVEMRLI